MNHPIRRMIWGSLSALCLGLVHAATPDAPASASASAPPHMAVLTSAQVIDILDQTVGWYRMLGSQQQSANQPSDLLILYANRQVATQVVNLAFDIAKANAELLSSDAGAAQSASGVSATSESLGSLQAQLQVQAKQVQDELERTRGHGAMGAQAGSAKIAELEGELAVINARKNLVLTMAQFVNSSDAKEQGANALKAYIDAMQASIPAVTPTAGAAVPSLNVAGAALKQRQGIWDLATDVLRLSEKLSTLESVEKATTALQGMFRRVRAAPLQQIQALSARSDALAAQADNASSAVTNHVRDQLDALAWQFKQTAAIVVPLSKEQVLLQQYRHNLANWQQSAARQYRQALAALALRVAVLVLILLALFAAAELWRRAVLRFEHELRRRHQWLLIRRITLWTLVIAVVGFTFISQLSSIATFAGLITAGVAVAMQSVIVSIVGYFFLIGKYGVRVGDRVQIGEVTGEVVELGLVRMHVMELSARSNFAPTGRIVAFANSIVFQASGGLFRQIPGVNFAWHELQVSLPGGIDFTAAKERLLGALTHVIDQYRGELSTQTQRLEDGIGAHEVTNATPQVQLRFTAAGIEAQMRYPVVLAHAAEIDERISVAMLQVVATLGGTVKR